MPPVPPAYLQSKVSERMRRIVDCIEDGRPTWDLCCDHGLVGLWAWHTRALPELHFVDRVPGIINDLERDVGLHLDSRGLAFHSIDAVSLVLPERPCNVILCGIGFRAFERIMSALYANPREDRLVASVHAEEGRLAPFLERTGWQLVQQFEVHEDGRLRTISAWLGPH